MSKLECFCPKCTTGTLRRFTGDEIICQKCGKIWGTIIVMDTKHVPRPGGNKYTEARS